MKTEIIKIIIDSRIFIKTINYINGIIYSINVYEIVEDEEIKFFSEDMASISLRNKIQSNKYNVDCSSKEIVDYFNKINEYNNKVKEESKKFFAEKNKNSEIVLFDNFVGINYVLIKDVSEVYSIFEVRIIDNRVVLYSISERYIYSVVMDAFSKLKINENNIDDTMYISVFCDDEKDVFISVMMEGKYVYFIRIIVDKIELTLNSGLSCITKITKDGLLLIEPTDDMFEVISKNIKTVSNKFIKNFN